MSKTLEELREHVRAKSEDGAPVSDEELQRFITKTSGEIDELFEGFHEQIARAYFASAPIGARPKPFEL